MKPKVLIVDDEQSICWGVARVCESLGYQTRSASSAEAGLQIAADWRPDLVVLDVRLPGIDGLTAVERFHETLGDKPIVIITAFGDLPTAARALQSGAYEYLTKPFGANDIGAVLQRALTEQCVAPTPEPPADDELVGRSPVMQTLFKRVALAAASDASVLLQGESGVGKELVARAIHRHSTRREGPFVPVNVAALSPSLAESELFGHTEGSFTGASRARDGLLVRADGGTLFLDEVADIPPPLQVKLLRVLEEGEVLPVGADHPIPTRFRVVAATHQDLGRCVATGSFRHDLYYRVCAFEIGIPALRDRGEDIALLASHFARRSRGDALSFAAETLDELRRRPWRGNVRELRNAIEHAGVLARAGVVLPEHLPPAHADGPVGPHAAGTASELLATALERRAEELFDDPDATGVVYERLLGEVERPLLRRAMDRYGNEYAPAARALGLHRTTLKRKLEEPAPTAEAD